MENQKKTTSFQLKHFEDSNLPKGFYVLFLNGKHWLCRFLKNGFQHCEVIQVYENGEGILVYFGSNGFYVRKQESSVIKSILYNDELTSVFIGENINQDKFNKVLYLMTCVSVSKAVIGINLPMIFTPYQLYKYLLNNGGVQLFVNSE